ncbi:MAG: glutamyl-tRNA reductase [Planctomycetota bacterium]
MSTLLLCGLNHKTASVELRERCAGILQAELKELCAEHGEIALLSTCNRVEAYAVGGPSADELRAFFARRGEMDDAEAAEHLYVREGRNAAKHLFFVASSLDSLVVGETQIRAQVKEAYASAQETGAVGPVLHQLFQAALRVSKEIAETTGVGRGTVSVAGAAADLAERVFGKLSNACVGVLGAGDTAELVVGHMQRRGVERVSVFNRTPERAHELAAKHNGAGHALSDLAGRLHELDVIVAAAGDTEPILTAPMVRRAIGKRRGRPIVMVDIAVPRAVDPAVDSIDNAYRYDMDALTDVTMDALRLRRRDFLHCCTLIDAAALRLDAGERGMRVGKTIQELESHYREVGDRELEQLERRLPDLNDDEREHLRRSIHRLVRKFLHVPVRALRDGGAQTSDALKRAVSRSKSDDE